MRFLVEYEAYNSKGQRVVAPRKTSIELPKWSATIAKDKIKSTLNSIVTKVVILGYK